MLYRSIHLLFLPHFVFALIFPKGGERLLKKIIDAQEATPLEINLDVGANHGGASSSRLNVNGMAFEISPKPANYDHPKMPGANGKTPQLSSGARALKLIEEGHYVDMSGTRHVKALNGCWEIFWRKNAIHGSLICGFDIPEEYHRNDASLPKCRLYMNFPLWTKASLDNARVRMEQILDRAKFLLDKKKDELNKMKNTINPFMKAFHFGSAAVADEKYSFQPLKSLEIIPSNDDIIWLQEDLLLNAKGLVFSTEESFDQRKSHVQLGAAYASLYHSF